MKQQKKDTKRLRRERDGYKEDARRYKKQRNEAEKNDDLLEDYRHMDKSHRQVVDDLDYYKRHCWMLEQQLNHQYALPARPTTTTNRITPGQQQQQQQQQRNDAQYEQFLQWQRQLWTMVSRNSSTIVVVGLTSSATRRILTIETAVG